MGRCVFTSNGFLSRRLNEKQSLVGMYLLTSGVSENSPEKQPTARPEEEKKVPRGKPDKTWPVQVR